MDQICLVVPIMAGKTEDARDFMRELEEQRKPVYDRSERRIGITKELRHLAHTPGGDQFVAHMESPNFNRALSLFSGSQDEFDLWFKRRLADATGLDLNTPPPAPLPESCPATLSAVPGSGGLLPAGRWCGSCPARKSRWRTFTGLLTPPST
jgi:hypothetical protein